MNSRATQYRRRTRAQTAFLFTGSCDRSLRRVPKLSHMFLSDSDENSSSMYPNSRSSDASRTSRRRRQNKYATSQNTAFIEAQISKIFGSDESGQSQFVPLFLAGRCCQAQDASTNVNILLLSSLDQCDRIAQDYHQYLHSTRDESFTSRSINALPIPLSQSTSSSAISLLSHTYSSTPLSKTVLLQMNSLFTNRDGGLFDNLPWSTWSIDPDLKERDAANNVVNVKYTLGKRAAYQRFMGKDWKGRSVSVGNLANRIRYWLENERQSEERDVADEPLSEQLYGSTDDNDIMLSLSKRLLELEAKEARMEIAECEERLAILQSQSVSNEDNDELSELDEMRTSEGMHQLDSARRRLESAELSMQELSDAITQGKAQNSSFLPFSFPWRASNVSKQQNKTQTLLVAILDKLTEQEYPPPYRGAIGYPAKLDTKEEMVEESLLPYASPYEQLIDVINDQLNSDVIGCVLEQTSLLEGNKVLGGALLLQRKGRMKSTTLAGETVKYNDDEDDFGNEGVLRRSMYLVECFTDEAIGVALALEAPVYLEKEIWAGASDVSVEIDVEVISSIKAENGDATSSVKDIGQLSVVNRLPLIRPLGGHCFSSKVEGDRVQSEKESNSIRIPLATTSQYFNQPGQVRLIKQRITPVFSTFNPVQSLDEYDSLSNDDKVRLLLKLNSFQGVLPRPRVVKASVSSQDIFRESQPPSALDDILLPLVEESVRRQYLIRDAEARNDVEEANALRAEMSPRQSALEQARAARDVGLEDEASKLEDDAELYKSLRADITQDEGSYSQFLDRDEWYERETRARIKRLDKSRFGSLLDGIDLP